ncbi:hypothetical protein SLEP1_g10687 [Rubroshorea leprosula]|uniref:Uncharacterized protein n=1 Tax=Rubroshorea leprosula TaxID=152421 RepID=A0AAV5I8V1_9ROSI|nr:hypothetical protein SLEP1_g10687 [Rubroshorea leprosula]
MLDVFVMLENYCHLLIERVDLIPKSKECPDELKEAASSLIFVSSRCGEFPELLHIREILSSKFGRDFTARAVELRNNCSVNPKMIRKLSTEKPSLESKVRVLKEIASENGITLNLEEDHPVIVEEKLDVNEEKEELETKESTKFDDAMPRDVKNLPEDINLNEQFSRTMKSMNKYSDVTAAAQEAFESAAYAAAAARAAVELSRSESRDNDYDDQSGSSQQKGIVYDSDGSSPPEFDIQEDAAAWKGTKYSNNTPQFEKIHPIENYSLKSESDDKTETQNAMEESKKKAVRVSIPSSASSLDSEGDISRDKKELLFVEQVNTEGREMSITRHRDQHIKQQGIEHEDVWKLPPQSLKQDPIGTGKLRGAKSSNFAVKPNSLHPNIERKRVSVRTKREHRI